MPDDDMRVLLQLQPLSVSFAPKTFSLRPTQKIRIDLVGAGTSTSPPRPDNGVLPSPALDRNSAHIVSSGAYFTLNTSAQESNHIRVNNYLLSNNPCTLKHGDIVEFGHASFVRYDEYYDDDGDYECWPCFSFAPDLSFKVHLTFPPRFDTRRVWTDPFSDPIAYVPPSSVPCIKPKISLSLTSSERHPSPVSTRVLEHGPQISAPSSSPPRKSPAPQFESVSVPDSAAPLGTNWAGVAQLIEELHEAAPSPPSASAKDSIASSSPTSGSPTVGAAHYTFCYGDFVGAMGTALPIVPTGASSGPHDTMAAVQTSTPPPTIVATGLSIPSRSAATSVSTSGLASDPINKRQNIPLSHDTTVRMPLHSAETALRRVGAAWLLARRAADAYGLTSAEVAVRRMGAAWRRSRGLVNNATCSSVLPADRLGSSPASSGSVVDARHCCGNDGIKRSSQPVAANQHSVTTGPSPASLAPIAQYGRHTPAAAHSPPMNGDAKRSLLSGIFPVTASLTDLLSQLLALLSQLPQPFSVSSSTTFPIQHHAQPPPYRIYPYLPALPPIHLR